ncbi:hypothetical protein DBV05_g10744 [Lasiodiplodia theobromae]|uniref:Uncharacterized protein n=1 Tax=Lasiodiplodia theobromae TaxID=45133 RepID=A0A5N5CYX4_9PEZI|nr:hypothetical protein DBV05_g10744 [Lasiodiplodia theobromae]
MHFHSIYTLLVGVLALGCAAKDHHGHSNSTDHAFNATVHACHQMAKLAVLSEIAANQTEADKFLSHHDDQAKAKAKLDGAAAQLKAMSANTTLVATCQIVNAHDELKSSCKEMKHLQKFADAATNATLKQEFLDKAKNDTKIEDKIAAAASKLQSMQSNTTLVDQCAQLAEEKQADSAQKAASTSAAAASPTASSTSMGERVAVGKVWMGLAAAVALGAVSIL